MPFDDKGMLDNDQAKIMLQNMIKVGRAGLFSWNIDDDQFHVMETFTGRTFEHVNTLEEFLREMVFHKDIEMVLHDLKHFLTNIDAGFQSTFRILDSDGKIRWLLTKGSVVPGNRMSAIMYDVTEGNLQQGHDLKTNLMNNDTFMRKLAHAIDSAEKSDQHGALLYIDISNFHSIINRHGFEFGNLILHKFSRIILGFVGEQDEIARFPYDKFMILLNNVSSLSDIEKRALDIITIFEDPITVNGEQIY